MRSLTLVVGCALGLAVAGHVATAQTARADSGARVRLSLHTAPDYIYQGVLLAPVGDTVVVQVRGKSTLRVPRRDVRQLQVGTRARRGANTVAGIGIGVFTGAAFGAVLGSATSSPDDFFGPEFAAALGASFFGVIGGVTGGIIGYNHRGTKWRDVPMTARVSTRGVALSLAF